MKTFIKQLILKFKYKECILNTTQIHQHANLGKGVNLAKDVTIGKNVYIGDYTYVNNYSTISSAKIGSYCSIGPYCMIGPDSHPIDWISTSPIFYQNFCYKKESGYIEPKNHCTIGNDVWIGSHVIIMRGVVIGDGAILAAGSVITKDVLPYSITAGVPGKHMKFRFEKHIIDILLNKNIWNQEFSQSKLIELAENKQMFINYF
jgi:acetyltransferase-like isoleucine patch superfamily enzyme